MKWLDKMKKWFQTEEEIIEVEEIIIDDSIEPEQLKKLDFSKPLSEQTAELGLEKAQKEKKRPEGRPAYTEAGERDVEAKVLYQYPKGQFKFPMIPDGSARERRQRKPAGKRQEKERPAQESKKPAPQVREHAREEKRKTGPVHSGTDHSRKIIPSNKPFRPTEIPSPIYGFARPGKPAEAEEIVEYELMSRKAEEPVLKAAAIDIPAVYRKKTEKEEEATAPSLSSERAATEKMAYLSEAAAAGPVLEEQDVKAPVLPVMEEQDVTAPPLPVMEEQLGAGPEPEPEAEEAVQTVYEETNAPVSDKSQEEAEEISEVLRTEIMLDEMGSLPEAANPAAEATTEAPVTVPVQEPEDIPQIQEEEAEPKEEILRAAEPPRKKHMPFNVLMLKKDKEKVIPAAEKKSPETKSVKADEPESGKIVPLTAEYPGEDENPYYAFPSIDFLTPPAHSENDREWLEQQSAILDGTLKNFNVRAKVVNVTQGPAVTRFEVQPEPGVKVNKITNLMDDIKLSLAAGDLRMEAPIPGKHTIGIEIPNRKSKPVFLREILESEEFTGNESPLTAALGLDISGRPAVTDLKKMPHGLIAGATGSGKSVCINSMLISLLYKAAPHELKLLLIDPKMVELAPYNQIPHLVSPVITDVKAATAALKWAVEEMERRYELFAAAGVRDIGRYNQHAHQAGQHAAKLPYILIIIDELADLMMMSPADVEEAICRIAQKARACGIHMIVATQRPSVDVITGLIKANIPTRIAFSVSSQVDSRTIIDSGGAEKLLGRGDMLFAGNGSSKTVRLQGTYVSDDEIDAVVRHVKQEQEPQYLFRQEELLNKIQAVEESDELFYEACEFVVSQKAASASALQRRFHVGYNRATRLVELMESQGIVSESRGSKPRDVLISEEELEMFLDASPS